MLAQELLWKSGIKETFSRALLFNFKRREREGLLRTGADDGENEFTWCEMLK
jgi:hypothetical protein